MKVDVPKLEAPAEPGTPCPFCHYELDMEEASCSNCGASLRRIPGVSVGVKARTFLFAGGMLIVSAIMLTECVLAYLPGEPKSGYNGRVSHQQPIGPRRDPKSAEVRDLLADWRAGAQRSQNPPPAIAHQKPLMIPKPRPDSPNL